MIDLDHNATAPMLQPVRVAMVESLHRTDVGNPSSIHARGREARAMVEEARRHVAAACRAEPLGVTFTASGTEANALGVLGLARARRRAGHCAGVLTSAIEHPSVTSAVAVLEREGHPIVRVPVDGRGRIDPAAVGLALRDHPQVGLVTLSAANHELGNRYDVAAIARAAKSVREDIAVHADAVQALGKVEVTLEGWGVDALSVSAHKIGGPMGAGALVHAKHTGLEPLVGGHQERGRRGGTEALPVIVGFGAAARHLPGDDERRRVAAMATELRSRLVELGARIHGDVESTVGNTVNFAFEGCPGELMCMSLDLEGFACSTGAACSAGTLEPSKVLLAIGLPPTQAAQAVRVSLGPSNTPAHLHALLDALPAIVARVREAQRGAS